MTNFKPKTDHLIATRWKTGVSGNPTGKPKGAKHLSTWIREMLADDSFTVKFSDGSKFKGVPVRAIVGSLIIRALQGDLRSIDLLARYGYGSRLDIVTDDRPLAVPIYSGVSAQTASDKPL